MPERVTPFVVLEGAGKAEVEDLGPAVLFFDPDVIRLDVAVDHPPRVGVVQRLGNLPADAHHVALVELPLTFQPCLQRLAAEILHGDEGNIAISPTW